MFLQALGKITKPEFSFLFAKKGCTKTVESIPCKNFTACETCIHNATRQQTIKAFTQAGASEKEVENAIYVHSFSCYNCPKVNSTKIKVNYYNRTETHSISSLGSVVSKRKNRFSKTQIKQYLLYMFMPISDGAPIVDPETKSKLSNNALRSIIKNVDEREIAKLLGCSIKTVRANNQVLENEGLINVFKADSKKVNIRILGYKDRFLTAEEGGRGYLTLTKEALLYILKLEHVNDIRLFLKLYFFIDRVSKEDGKTIITVDELKTAFPEYISDKKITQMMEQLIVACKKTISIFLVTKCSTEGSFAYKLNKDFNPAIVKEKLKQENQKPLDEFLEAQQMEVKEKDKVDLLDLTVDLGLEEVLIALTIAHAQGNKIRKLGAYIRTIIKNSLSNSKFIEDELLEAVA